MTGTETDRTVVPLSTAQKQAGRFLSRCHADVVGVTVFGDVEVEELAAWRPAGGKAKPTFTHMLVAALVRALDRHPGLNAHYNDGDLIRFDDVHLGLAVAVDNGDLLTPVLHGLRGRTLDQIADLTDAQIHKARTGSLTLQDTRVASFTLSNLGQGGIARYATPVVPLPQVAILATTAIRREPVARGDRIVAVPVLPVSLSFDHRAVNGAAASAFLDTFAQILKQPDRLTEMPDSDRETVLCSK